MTKYRPTVAVVIPAHNEQRHIKACLESLINQTVPVDQIIVVSNSSTDKTAQIASQFPPVSVIEIKEKGITNARNLGFSNANCDIIARLNADVICAPDWNEQLIKSFSQNDVWAVAGVAKTMLIPVWPYFYTTFWSRIYLLMAEAYFAVPILWGANMAVKKTAWEKVVNTICLDDNEVHEDQDISLHIVSAGGKIIKNSKLIVTTQEKSYFSWDKYKAYNNLRKKTKKSHKSILQKSKTLKFSNLDRFVRLIIAGIPTLIFTVASFLVMITLQMQHYLFGKHH